MPKFKVVLHKTIEYSYVTEVEANDADDAYLEADALLDDGWDTMPWSEDETSWQVGKVAQVTHGPDVR